MTSSKFGTMPDGTEIVETIIGDGDLTAKIINYGAVIRDVRLSGVDRPLVLGFERLEDYLEYSPHFGAVAGRYANRIADGHLMIDGTVSQLSLNEDGRNHLHGGVHGFGVRRWRFVDQDRRSVTLAITSADGDEGYPGNVEALCRYSIARPGTLRVDFEAKTDAPTVVNLTQHSYFNLGGGDDILDHRVVIHADSYTPVDSDMIPTGAIVPVTGTDFDFRKPRRIRRMNGTGRIEYDVNFVVDAVKASVPRPVARLASPRGDITLDIASTEPGVQFYDGCMMRVIPVPGLDGRKYGLNAGCCFEPQYFPDSPNRPEFPSAVLRPGETYHHTALFTFARH